MLHITGLYAGILGLLAAVLTLNVIRLRFVHSVQTGDGGVIVLLQAMRAHGNFIEQTPMMLILLGVAEGVDARPVLLHVIGIAIVVSRVASAWGLSQSLGITPGRGIGAVLGITTLMFASVVVLLATYGIR